MFWTRLLSVATCPVAEQVFWNTLCPAVRLRNVVKRTVRQVIRSGIKPGSPALQAILMTTAPRQPVGWKESEFFNYLKRYA